jgi:hypothetical protein
MKHCIDPSLIRMLRHGVETGLWTLENLDTPSPGFRACTGVDRRTFPSGYEGVQFRNLLRDMPAVEAVQAVPDPKDFDTVLPPSNAPAQDIKLPITLDEEESLNPVSEGTPLQATEHQSHANDLEPAAGPQALPWE